MNFETLRRIGEIEKKLEAYANETRQLRARVTELEARPAYGGVPDLKAGSLGQAGSLEELLQQKAKDKRTLTLRDKNNAGYRQTSSSD